MNGMKQLFTFIFLLSMPYLAYGAPSGQQLYDSHCAVCHGANGNGGVGVPLALPDFQYGVTDDFLAKTIRHGRPGRVMPAFPYLSDSEISTLVKHIRQWAPGKPIAPPKKKIIGNLNHGKELYAKHCASCHGASLEGQPEGKGMPDAPVDFVAPLLGWDIEAGEVLALDPKIERQSITHIKAHAGEQLVVPLAARQRDAGVQVKAYLLGLKRE